MDSKMFQIGQMEAQFELQPADIDTFNIITAISPEGLMQFDSACPSLFGGVSFNNTNNNSDSSPSTQSPEDHNAAAFPGFEGLDFIPNLSINTNYVLHRGNAAASCDSTDNNSANISPAGSEDLRKSNSCNSKNVTELDLDLDLDIDIDIPSVNAAPAMAQVQPARFNYNSGLQGTMNSTNPNPPIQDHNEGIFNGIGTMRDMIFRVAAMQPIHIDPESIKRPKRRNVKISKDPQSVAARHRRERISERIRILQRLVPGGTKMDTASMLDEAIHYVKFLKKQVQALEGAAHHAKDPSCSSWPTSTTRNFSHAALTTTRNISNLNYSAFNSMATPNLSNGLHFSAMNSNSFIHPLDRSGVAYSNGLM